MEAAANAMRLPAGVVHARAQSQILSKFKENLITDFYKWTCYPKNVIRLVCNQFYHQFILFRIFAAQQILILLNIKSGIGNVNAELWKV